MSTALILLSEFRKTEIELWKPVAGFQGYDVSSLGHVRSYWRKSGSGRSNVNGRIRGSWTYVLGDTPVTLQGAADKDGYRSVALKGVDGKFRTLRVHRIVAFAFILNARLNATKINHKNNVKADNRVANLEWCTQRENEDHARAIGVWPKGVTHGMTRISEDEVRAIRHRHANGETAASLARYYGFTDTHIAHIVHRRLWKEVD